LGYTKSASPRLLHSGEKNCIVYSGKAQQYPPQGAENGAGSMAGVYFSFSIFPLHLSCSGAPAIPPQAPPGYPYPSQEERSWSSSTPTGLDIIATPYGRLRVLFTL